MTTSNSSVQPPPTSPLLSLGDVPCTSRHSFPWSSALAAKRLLLPLDLPSPISAVPTPKWEGPKMVSISFASIGASCQSSNAQLALYSWNPICKCHKPTQELPSEPPINNVAAISSDKPRKSHAKFCLICYLIIFYLGSYTTHIALVSEHLGAWMQVR